MQLLSQLAVVQALAVSPLADQEVEDAGTPSWRLFSQAKGIRVRRPAVRLSVLGSPPFTPPEQPRHDGVLHLLRALHRLHPGGQLAATATHAGRFSVSTPNNDIKRDPVKRNTIVGVNETLFSFYSYWPHWSITCMKSGINHNWTLPALFWSQALVCPLFDSMNNQFDEQEV